MAHPLSGPYDYKNTSSDAIEVRAKRALDTLHRYQANVKARDTALSSQPKGQRQDLPEVTLEPIATQDLQAIPILAAYAFQGFDHYNEINGLTARQYLKDGAEIERLTNSEDKLCTVMHAMFQVAGIAMSNEEDTGRKTLLRHKDWIISQAKAGHPRCIQILSLMHGRGNLGVERNLTKALELLETTVEKTQDPFAYYDIGLAYAGQMEKGVDSARRKIKPNDAKAAIHLHKAAEMGHTDARDTLGYLIIVSFSTKDEGIGFSVQLAQAEIEKPGSTTNLGRVQDAQYGLSLIEQAANDGRLASIYAMALAYLGDDKFNGVVKRDLPTAVAWLQKAADKGYPRGTIDLAKAYEDWFEETGENHAEHNEANALVIYDDLLGRPRDVKKKTVSTQPLTPEQLVDVKKRRQALEGKAIKWDRQADGHTQLTFNDGTAITVPPYISVKTEMAKAAHYSNGTEGYVKNPVQALALYKALLARKENEGVDLPKDDEIKTIKRQIEAIENKADQVVVDPSNGNRTLVFLKVDGKPFVNVYSGPHKNW